MIDNGIIINLPGRTLYCFKDDQIARSFSLEIGMLISPGRAGKRRRENSGLLQRKENPIGYVPPSLQKKMVMEGKEVIPIVPAGPDNLLGRYAIKT
jgi:hypothetical protein